MAASMTLSKVDILVSYSEMPIASRAYVRNDLKGNRHLVKKVRVAAG